MRREHTVGRLLTRAFAVLVAFIVCSGLAEMTIVLLQHRVVRELATHVQPLELANAHLRGVLGDAQRGLRGYLLTGDGQLLDTYYVAHSDYYLARISIRGFAGARETAAVESQLDDANAWWGLAEHQRQAPPRSAEAADFVEQGKPLFQAFVNANRALDADLAARAATLQRRSAKLGGATVIVVATLTLVAQDRHRYLLHASRRGSVSFTWTLVLTREGRAGTRVQSRVRLGPVKYEWLAERVGGTLDLISLLCLAHGLRERVTDYPKGT